MNRTETLTIGDRVFVDDELATGIECVVRGFNDLGEPILQAVSSRPLRYHCQDRRVLDYPWHLISRDPPPPSLLEATAEVLRLTTGTGGPAILTAALSQLRRAYEKETEPPF